MEEAGRAGKLTDLPVIDPARRPSRGIAAGITASEAPMARAMPNATAGWSSVCAPATRATAIPAATVTTCTRIDEPAAATPDIFCSLAIAVMAAIDHTLPGTYL